MPFPESERVVYDKNPLIEVVCQLRFPTILRISGDVAEFQERIRQDYPLYEVQHPDFQLPAELASLAASVNFPKAAGPVVHRFSTLDGGRTISISQDFVAMVELRYSRWESFREEMQKAEAAVRDVYQPAFYSRVGLRYKDLISRRNLGLDQARWRDLLQPHILAELGADQIGEQVKSIQTETTVAIPDIPDAGVRLVHALASGNDDEVCYLIDSDFWTQGKGAKDEPFAVLDKFNRLAGRLFRWAITDQLHAAMDPRGVPS